MICLVRRTIVVVRLGHDKNVVTTTERILEDCGWSKIDIGVGALCLVSGRAVEIPLAKLADVGDRLGYGLEAKKEMSGF